MILLERIKAESTAFGKLCQTWIPCILSVLGIAEYFLELSSTLPDGYVPNNVKIFLFVCVAIVKSFGHLSVKKDETKVD